MADRASDVGGEVVGYMTDGRKWDNHEVHEEEYQFAVNETGKNWSYLATEMNFQRVREMQIQNLIVPLVGDFGGPKTVRTTGQYLRDHGAIVNLFYLSNVEDYIQPVMQGYERNIASLPVDSSSLA